MNYEPHNHELPGSQGTIFIHLLVWHYHWSMGMNMNQNFGPWDT